MIRLMRYIGFVACFLFIGTVTVHADIGPKESISVEIIGIEDQDYTVTFVGKETTPPYRYWEDDAYLEYNPIMEYNDEVGYHFVGDYWVEEGNSTVRWGYYPPSPFKIIIMTDDGTMYVSKALNKYAFSSYYKVDLTNSLTTEPNEDGFVLMDDIERNYSYGREITSFSLRLVLTILIEIAIAWLFVFRKKKELHFILIVNIITQVFLNGVLNMISYKEGPLDAIMMLIELEFLILLIESVAYSFRFKKNGIRAVLYAFIANVASFLIGILIYGLLYS
jgi:hypothetical protein